MLITGLKSSDSVPALGTASFSSQLRLAARISTAWAALVLSGCDKATTDSLPLPKNNTTAPASQNVDFTGTSNPAAAKTPGPDSLNWDNDPGVVTTLPPSPAGGQQDQPYPDGMTPHFIQDKPPSAEQIEKAQQIENEQARRENREPVDLKELYSQQQKLGEKK